MQITKRTETWSRWAGHIADLDDAGRTAAAYIEEWTGKKPPVRVVAALPRRVEEADSLADFDALVDTRDLALIESLKIEIGALTGPRVSIHAERKTAPAMALEVSGDDKVKVSGLYDEVRSKVDRGKQFVDASSATLAVVLAAVFSGIAGLVISEQLGWYVPSPADPSAPLGSPSSSLTPAGLVLIAGLVVIALWIGAHAFPSLEILPADGHSALERWRAKIGGAIAAVVLGIVASAVWGSFGH